MMHMRVIALFAIVAMLIGAGPAISHHSNSAYQVDKVMTITGVVKEWKWSNPHTWLYVMVTDDKGAQTEWAVEGRAPSVLGRAGWDRFVLKAGEKVTVHMSPAKDGTHVGIIARVTKEDGTILGNGGQ